MRVEQGLRGGPPYATLDLLELPQPAGVDGRGGIALQLEAHDVDDERLLRGSERLPRVTMDVRRLPATLPRLGRRVGERGHEVRDDGAPAHRHRAALGKRDRHVVGRLAVLAVEGDERIAHELGHQALQRLGVPRRQDDTLVRARHPGPERSDITERSGIPEHVAVAERYAALPV
jgi:hypothetical protein